MTQTEREMVQPLNNARPQERYTSLQPTYEDSVEPQPDDYLNEMDEAS